MMRWAVATVLAVWVAGCTQATQNLAVASGPREMPASVGIGLQAEKSPTKAVKAKPPTQVSEPRPYKIGSQDVLEIAVFKAPELNRVVQVADGGAINFPLVGNIDAAGRTASEIERELSRRLGETYLRNPQITVYLKEYNSQRITVEGAVKKPGVFAYRGQTSLLQAIALAEGTDALSDSNALVFRTINGKRAAAKFDISRIRSGADPDPNIEPGDILVVPTSAIKETFNTLMKAMPLAGVFALL